MDFTFTEEQNLLRESMRKMLERIATPEYVRRCDQGPRYPAELMAAAADGRPDQDVDLDDRARRRVRLPARCAPAPGSTATTGMQIMGGYGYIMEFDMQRHYRDARWDREERLPDENKHRPAERGYLGPSMAYEYGGSGAGLVDTDLVIEEPCSADRQHDADAEERDPWQSHISPPSSRPAGCRQGGLPASALR